MIEAASRTKEVESSLRPEAIAFERDTRVQAGKVQVEILSVDKGYKPKVSTWGVFARPTDISAAYGGGRNLPPGGELEPAAARAEKDERIRAAVQSYRKLVGFDVEVADQPAVDSLMADAAALMERGQLEAAAEAYGGVLPLAPIMSESGGQARLGTTQPSPGQPRPTQPNPTQPNPRGGRPGAAAAGGVPGLAEPRRGGQAAVHQPGEAPEPACAEAGQPHAVGRAPACPPACCGTRPPGWPRG